jgi:hypothetical protein
MPPFTVNLNAGRAIVQHAAQPVPTAALGSFPVEAAAAYGGSFQGQAAAAYGGWMPAQAVAAPLPSYGFEGSGLPSYGFEGGGGGMQYGVGHSSNTSVYNDDPGLAGVGYAVPFQAAAVSGGAAGVEGGVGSGLQGQKMKNQQISFQQQQQQQKQEAVEAPPPLIKFNAPKLSTGNISICTHPVPHTRHALLTCSSDARANRKTSDKKVWYLHSPPPLLLFTRHSRRSKSAASPSHAARGQLAVL